MYHKYLTLAVYSKFSSVTRVQLFATPGLQHARLPCPSPTPGVYSNSCPSSRWCYPAISSSVIPFSCLLFSIFLSIRVFSNESVICLRWPKYWSFSISPSNEYPALISFRMDWLDLLAVQGTLKSLLHHHSSKASILQHSAFFIGQLSHLYMTAGICTLQLTKNGISQISSQLNLVSIVWYNRKFTTSLANELMSQSASHFNRDFLEMEFLYFYWM